jgi:hypothetical protein
VRLFVFAQWFRKGCPDCGSARRVRSRRRGIAERFFGVLFLPYRCRERDHRFFKFRWLRDEPEAAPPPNAELADPMQVIVRRAS